MSQVVITGLGACTNRAQDTTQLWEQVKSEYNPPVGTVPNDVFKLTEMATLEALRTAELWNGERITGIDNGRVGCTLSASKPILSAQWGLSPMSGLKDLIAPEVVGEWICGRVGIEGERRNVIAACATGAYSVALGASWIEQGLCDVVVAGSVEAPLHPLMEAGFKRMGVVSRESCMRPFDKRRSGFVFGHGAGVIVLESRAHARTRGIRPRAGLSGWGMGADGHSAVAFNSNGRRIAQVIHQALDRAHLVDSSIGHVNAHGTATEHNDWIETQALRHAFGSHAQRLNVSATKSSTGHLLGAAGSVELILTVQALEKQFIPPTRHLDYPDPECSLDYTPRQGHPAQFDHALSLSFGFGGSIGALVVSKHE